MIFAAKTTASGLIAPLVAFTFNLDQPQWALLTVFIVAQPQSGRVLFLGALAFWIGFCTFGSQYARNFAAYSFVLSPPLRGHVESVSHGIADRDNPSGPELLANANPTFEWVRLAQRIPVRIHIDRVPEGVLVMTCTVVVDAPRQWATLAALRGRNAATQ